MANGNLGVESAGGGPSVVVNIVNNSGTDEVETKEKTDAWGNKQIDVIIGQLVDRHIASGKADRAMASRYNVKVRGV
jgi:hypothetical protein